MLVLPRAAARAFRAVARRCPGGRGPAPPVRLRADGQVLTLSWCGPAVTLALTVPHAGLAADLVVPPALLDAVEKGAAEAAEVEAVSSAVVARWPAEGPRCETFDRPPPSAAGDPGPAPARWATVPASFLTALHEAGRTAAREATGRHALDRVQVGPDRVVAADGRQALVQGGFALPVPTPVLVPAVPVFAAKEFRGHPVRIGRTAARLVVAIGPWTIGLRVDSLGKFPDVDAVIPNVARPTVVTIGEIDATRLLTPGPDGAEDNPVTLVAAAGRVAVAGGGGEVILAASSATGPAVRYPVDPRHLRRALALGFRTFRFAGPGRPFVATDGDRTFVAVGHAVDDPRPALPSTAIVPAGRPPGGRPDPLPPLEISPMKNVLNGAAPPAGRADPPADEPVDLVAEAEALRAALVEVVHRAAKLIAGLKSHRKEKKAITQVWSSLQSLRLGP